VGGARGTFSAQFGLWREVVGVIGWRLAMAGAVLAAAVGAANVVSAAGTSAKLTINATPNPIIAGEAVLVYGQLNAPIPGGHKIVLHERIDPAGSFTTVGTAVTNAAGFYEFTSTGDAVTSNRSWFASSPIAGSPHSRTVHELVASTLTLASSATSGETNHPLTFTGQVLPTGVHTGEQVVLQKQTGATGHTWKSIAKGTIDASSSYSISRTFLLPGALDLRVFLAGDTHNTAAASDSLTAVIQQAENPTFSINTSQPTITVGQPTTISGRLFTPGSTSVALPATSVTLWGREAGGSYAPITSTKTGSDGSYGFTQSPSHNETYQVRTTFAPPARRRTAQLFEGVADQTTIDTASTNSLVGTTQTFTGTVTPDKAGNTIDLEELGSDGHFHTIKTGLITPSSAYSFTWTFGAPGTKTFRVAVPGGNTNIKGISPAIAIAVALPPVASLPTP
jgi:hypothetical protein